MVNNYYVYYSYEPWGNGYIGYRKCPNNLTPETDKYLGSYRDKSFNPTEKIILFQSLTKEEALGFEIMLHDFYQVDICFSYSASGENHCWYGKKHSVETKQKSVKNLGTELGEKFLNPIIRERFKQVSGLSQTTFVATVRLMPKKN